MRGFLRWRFTGEGGPATAGGNGAAAGKPRPLRGRRVSAARGFGDGRGVSGSNSRRPARSASRTSDGPSAAGSARPAGRPAHSECGGGSDARKGRLDSESAGRRAALHGWRPRPSCMRFRTKRGTCSGDAGRRKRRIIACFCWGQLPVKTTEDAEARAGGSSCATDPGNCDQGVDRSRAARRAFSCCPRGRRVPAVGSSLPCGGCCAGRVVVGGPSVPEPERRV